MRLGLLLLSSGFLFTLFANSGSVPLGRTSALADGGQTCTSCHTALAGNAFKPGKATIQALSYTPGVRQTVSVSIDDPAAQRWGFQITARLLSAETVQAGSFVPNAQVEVRCGVDPCSSAVQYASQRSDASGAVNAVPRVFSMEWTPPLVNQGPIVFYASALGGDGDSTAAGDRTYTARLVVTPAGSNLTTFKLDTPDTPSDIGTEVHAINNAGRSVGTFYDNGRVRSFLRDPDGTIAVFDIGNISTNASGLNNVGQVTGFVNGGFGFLRAPDGTVQAIDYPGALHTFPFAISDSGAIAGSYRVDADGPLRGFRRDANGTFTSYEEAATGISGVPGSIPQVSTELLSIGNDGVILGRSTETRDAGNGITNIFRRSFVIETNGTKSYFGASSSFAGPISRAMNSLRQVAGSVLGSAFIGNTSGGLTSFTIPGSATTTAFGINDAGQIAGSYSDTSGISGVIVNPCVAPVSPAQRNHGSGAESGSISVAGGPGCVWLASSDAPWIQITSSNAAGVGASSIRYQLQPNPGAVRSGTMRVAGQQVTITQASSECAYVVAPQQGNVGLGGGPLSFTVSTQPSCPWTASSNSLLTPITPDNGLGTGTAQTTIPANLETSSATWTFRVAGQTVLVNQSAAPCTYFLSSIAGTVPSTGQSGELIVNTAGNCAWTATSSAPWLVITSGSSGTGTGSVRWTAAPQIELTGRSASITAGGQTFTVNQLAAPACIYSTSTGSMNLGSAGGTSQFTLTAAGTCPWVVNTFTSWLHITSAVQGQGQTTVTFTYDANPGPQRWGSIIAGGVAVQIGQQGAVAEAGLRFVPVTPCRLFDSRPGEGLGGAFGPPQLLAGVIREVPVTQGGCDIPSNAVAYSLNVTAVPDGYLGYLSVVPLGFSGPPVSTLNSWNGRIVANAAMVPAGDSGGIQVYVTDASHVILDINGYYVGRSDPTRSLVFYPQTPCRISDSRSTRPAPYGLPIFGAAESRDIPIPANTSCPVPAEAEAFSLNATVVPEVQLGFLSLWPTGSPRPNVSTLNSSNGAVVANAAIVPSGTNGSISAFVSDSADLILDINGSFAEAGGADGLHFYPVIPCRVVDTRSGQAPAGTQGSGPLTNASRTFPLGQQCGLPATAKAYALNVTAVPLGGLGFLTMWPAGLPQPEVSTLNSFDGQVVANLALVPAGTNGAVSAFALGSTDLVIDVMGYFAP